MKVNIQRKFIQLIMLLNLINSKINLYLPKKPTTNLNFIKSLKNILIKDELRVKTIIRKDFKARIILEIIKKLDFKNNLKWLTYDDINYYLQPLLKSSYNIKNEKQVNKKLNEIFGI